MRSFYRYLIVLIFILSAGLLICNVIARYMLSAFWCICVTFQIEVENPCVIMSQDKSREFLHSGNDKDKFKVLKNYAMEHKCLIHVLFSHLLLSNANSCGCQWSGALDMVYFHEKDNTEHTDSSDFRIYYTILDKLGQLGFSH